MCTTFANPENVIMPHYVSLFTRISVSLLRQFSVVLQCRSSDGAETQKCPRSPNIYLCLTTLDLKETQHYKRGGLTKVEWRRHCDNITRVGECQCKASGFFTEMLENEAEVA